MKTDQFRWLIRLTTICLAFIVLVIILISVGFFDPSPIGQKMWQENISKISLNESTEKISWLDQEMPNPPYTIRLTASHLDGEADIAYGLVLGNDMTHFAVAVSPLGYLAVWEEAATENYYINWKPWPHVHTGKQPNEIWLDVEENQATIRINREFLWEGSIDPAGNKIGILGESFAGDSVIDVDSLELFTEVDQK